MNDLHSAIMNLRHKAHDDCMTPTERMGYAAGHRDARHAAAELASESVSTLQARITELEEALREAVRLYANYGLVAGAIDGEPMAAGKWINAARAALKEPK
jgi:hypothetical protein